jgi:hypothetical protein
MLVRQGLQDPLWRKRRSYPRVRWQARHLCAPCPVHSPHSPVGGSLRGSSAGTNRAATPAGRRLRDSGQQGFRV